MASFEEHGIPLVPDEYKSSYLESLEVMIMLDTLRAINNPLNDYALVALLRSPMFHFNEDDLARIAVQADEGQFYDKLLVACTKTGLHPEVVTKGLDAKLTLSLRLWQIGVITVSGIRSMTSFGRFTTTVSITTMLVAFHEPSNVRLISTPLPCVLMPMKRPA